MKKVDRLNWKEFFVGDLFDIHPTKAYKITNKDLLVENGENPVVVNSAYNNGIGGYTNLDATEKGNTITFSDTTTADAIFYQESCFVGYPHVQGLYPKCYGDKWSKYSLLFFLAVFKKASFVQNFDYANKFTRDLAKNIIVSLPSDSAGNPDFAYMEEYMKDVFEKTKYKLLNQQKINIVKTSVNIKDWKEFDLSDLGFKNYHGKRLKKADRIGGNIPFITAGKENQGVVGLIGNKRPTYHNPITIDMFGNIFYHRGNYAGDDNVYFFVNDNISEEHKLFIVASLQSQMQSIFAYVDQFRQDNASCLNVLLPATPEGQPNYAYMENYMKDVMKKQSANLDVLQMLLIGC